MLPVNRRCYRHGGRVIMVLFVRNECVHVVDVVTRDWLGILLSQWERRKPELVEPHKPEPGQLYRHRKRGTFIVVDIVKTMAGTDKVLLYAHDGPTREGRVADLGSFVEPLWTLVDAGGC